MAPHAHSENVFGVTRHQESLMDFMALQVVKGPTGEDSIRVDCYKKNEQGFHAKHVGFKGKKKSYLDIPITAFWFYNVDV